MTLTGHNKPIFAVDMSEDGTLVITGSADRVSINFFLLYMVLIQTMILKTFLKDLHHKRNEVPPWS